MDTNTRIPRMRTVKNAFAEIKKHDPDTDLTLRALYRMVVEGDIPYESIGNKKLINLDLLLAKLNNSDYNETDTCASSMERSI